MQPNPAGGPPIVPQALNRYAATVLGQPGVMEAAGSGGLSGITIASYVVGLGKSLAQEIAAAGNLGIFGRNIALATSLRYAGTGHIAFEASVSSLNVNRTAIEKAGGVFVESIEDVQRPLANGGLSKFRFRQDIFKFEVALDEIKNLASTGTLVQKGFYRARTSATLLDVETVWGVGRVARFSPVEALAIGGITDAILTGGFQFLDDLQNPYLTPNQRYVRAGVAFFGGGIFGTLGGLAGASLTCGPYAPACIASGGLVGSLIWGFGLQPLIFDAYPSLNPTRNLRPLD